MTGADYRAHVLALARAFGVRVVEDSGIGVEDSALVEATFGLGGPVLATFVRVPPITNAFTYAVALHELGHQLAACGRLDHEKARASSQGQRHRLQRTEEDAAWAWAAHQALEWNAEMDAARRIGLESYEQKQPMADLLDRVHGAAAPATKTIAITRVAPVEALDPLLVSGTLYLTNDGSAAAAQAEAVLLAALAGSVAIGTIALSQKEQLVALMVYGGRFVLQTLRPASAIRTMPVTVLPAVDPQMVGLARQLVASLDGPLELEQTTDAYADGLTALIAAKAGGQPLPQSRTTAAPPITDLKAMLEASVKASGKGSIPAVPKPTPDKMTVVRSRKNGRKTGTRG